MFVKKSVRKKGSKEYKTRYLTRGYYDKKSKKVKHEHLANLSHLPENLILIIQNYLQGNTSHQGKFDIDDMKLVTSLQYGNIAVFSKLYEQNFGKYFSNQKYSQALKTIVVNKIFDPKSKNSINNWTRQVDLPALSNRNDFYDSLDYLDEEQDKIEKRLSKKTGKSTILLYDITSTYFEGKAAEEICKNGYSRDHRPDRVQVNIGLIASQDGTPISVEVIAGNLTDKQTLQDQIDKIKNKFNIEELTFVFDRGMKSKVNLEYIQKNEYSYITALSHSELKKKADQNSNIQMSLFDKKDLAIFEINSKYYSLVHNPDKAYRDKHDRIKLISKTEEKLIKIQNFKRSYDKQVLQDKVSKIINKFKCEKYINYKIEEEAVKRYSLLTMFKYEEKIVKEYLQECSLVIVKPEESKGSSVRSNNRIFYFDSNKELIEFKDDSSEELNKHREILDKLKALDIRSKKRFQCGDFDLKTSDLEKFTSYLGCAPVKKETVKKKTVKEEVNTKPNSKTTKEAKPVIPARLTFTRNDIRITTDEKYDGFYMIESTNHKITGKDSLSQYKDLQLVERAFDSVKNHIKIRPVFHYTKSRIKGHIFSCFISYFLLHKFKQQCSDLLKEHSLDNLLTELVMIQKAYFEIRGFCFTKLSDLSELQRLILSKFKIKTL